LKKLIIEALNDAFAILEKQVPQTKKQVESLSIVDIKPVDLPLVMSEKGIPADAYFSGQDNGYDAWDDLLLCWEIDVPTTNKDKLKFRRHRFSAIAYKLVAAALTTNGYMRVGCSSRLFRQFDDTTTYDMYIDEYFDRLVDYYSLSFSKNEERS
jgi:hypothetical protein